MSSTPQSASVTGGARRDSTGPQGAGANPPQHQTSMAPPQSTTQSSTGSQQNLNQIVIEYLNKKGYSKTEAMLRHESSNIDAQGRTLITRAEDRGGHKYFTAFKLLTQWVDDNLDLYKGELRRLMWPIFMYSFLSLVSEYYPDLSKQFYDEYSKLFTREHGSDLRAVQFVRNPDHLESNVTAKSYRNNRYRLTLTQTAFYSLMQFLESKEKEGGSVIIHIIQNSMNIVTVDRAVTGKDRSFAAMVSKLHGDTDVPDEDEGIPGHNPGSANTDRNAPPVLPTLALGPLPTEPDMLGDVRDELEEEDAKNPPEAGQESLIDVLDQKIKREPSDDAPNRETVPLPQPLARDVAMEVLKIKENRDKVKLEPKSGGIGPGVSVVMYTLQNTFDTINCLDFSGDNKLVAAGTAQSYIQVWSLEGKPLPSMIENTTDQSSKSSSSRRLIGHSGPVYAVSFSPSIENTDASPNAVITNPRFLLSSSGDKTIRLWSLDTWSQLVTYKGHDHPVWDVTWGPFGHYFVSGGNDRTARLWSTESISPLRIFAGHDQDVDCVAFHPNNAYVFTGSSDKTVRMWDVSRGTGVRIFTGHTANITCLACAPSGRTLASADDQGVIILWDLTSGRRLKRMKGHARGGIWSMSWSVESTVIVSGGADNTVRVWDVLMQTEGAANPAAKGAAEGAGGAGGGAKIDGATVTAAAGGAAGVAGKRGKGKDALVTGDQISAFPTKKSPVYRVRFTEMNLVVAGGAYLP